MPRRLQPGEAYKGRPPGMVPLNVSVEAAALTLIRHYAPHRKALGAFISRLAYEHAAREELRQKIREAVSETNG